MTVPAPANTDSSPNETSTKTPVPEVKKTVNRKRPRQAGKAQVDGKKKPATKPDKLAPPEHVLLLDNGGDSVKYGWSIDASPQSMPNVTARLQQQWTVLVGDELSRIQNPNQLVGVTRSTERGVIVNLGNQIQVWKRILDLLGVSVPLQTATALALGWKTTRTAPNASDQQKKVPSSCAVLISVPPFCPRSVLDQIAAVWIEDFGFGYVGFCTASVCASRNLQTEELPTTCVVDMGYSSCLVVPTCERTVFPDAIRRLPIGGRHLVNILKYHVSYRQWNLMEQDWLLRQVLEETGYVSLDYNGDMKAAHRLPAGRRPFDREFVMPDFQTTFQGHARTPLALQQQSDEESVQESEDESFDEEDIKEVPDDPEEEDEQIVDEEERETLEQKRQRLLKQREDELRRKRVEEAEQQMLNVSVERFSICETLFHPSDSGFPGEMASLPAAILQSIEATPLPYRPALYRSIKLVGGLSLLPNLKERLQRELRMLAPSIHKVSIGASKDPINEAWCGLQNEARSYTTWISKQEWTRVSKNLAHATKVSYSRDGLV